MTRKYVVIAVYVEDNQRYATEVEAESSEEAEQFAQQMARDDNAEFRGTTEDVLIIAGTICGRTDEETLALSVF